MADLQKDLFGLKYSPNFSIAGLEEADINLQLVDATGSSTTVYGKVTDGDKPIPGATVKAFDKDGIPFKHTITDEQGEYVLEGMPAGSYSIAVVKSGYRMSDRRGIVLADNDTVGVSFALTADTTLALGAIAGVVTTGEDAARTPVARAKVSLLDADGKQVAVTYTADDGEFAFYDVAADSYTVVVMAEGYLAATPMLVTVGSGSILNMELGLIVDTTTYNGTVSGIIKDTGNNVVGGCFVGLYAVTTDDKGRRVETLVAITKTNTAGQYLFGGVAEGNYIVKAKKNK